MTTSILIASIFLLGMVMGDEFIMLPTLDRYAVMGVIAMLAVITITLDLQGRD